MAELKVPGREVRRLFDDLRRDDVLQATHNRQQQFTYGSLPRRRDFYFVATRHQTRPNHQHGAQSDRPAAATLSFA